MILYQHHAPCQEPWTRTKALIHRSSRALPRLSQAAARWVKSRAGGAEAVVRGSGPTTSGMPCGGGSVRTVRDGTQPPALQRRDIELAQTSRVSNDLPIEHGR